MSTEPNLTTPPPAPHKPEHSILRNVLVTAIVLMVIAVLGFYLVAPFLGIGLTMAAGIGAWSVVVITIVLFCSAVLLFFIIPGILIVLIALFAIAWTLLAIALFPFLFPVIIPVLIILLAVALIRRRRG